MKKNWKSSQYRILTLVALCLWLVVSCKTGNNEQESNRTGKRASAKPNSTQPGHNHTDNQYTCSMHPQIVQDKPGTCPICGMDLVKKVGMSGDSLVVNAELEALLQPTNSVVVANIGTVKPDRRRVAVEVQTSGMVTYDTRRLYTIPARFGGRIEKLYVHYNFQPIRKGQKLLELYSPDMVTAQRELLYLRQADADNTPLIRAANQKLRLLGVSDKQITDLIKSQKPTYSLAVFSPFDGYIIEETASAPVAAMAAGSGSASGSGMNGASGMGSGTDEVRFSSPAPMASDAPNGALLIREGQYVQAGQTLFRVVNASQLWAEFRLYAPDAAGVKPGSPLTITFDGVGSTPQHAKVSFVVPYMETGNLFVTVRAYLSGPGQPRVGQLARATLRRPAQEGLWIPATALLDLGNERVVFVKENGAFRPRRVQAGRQSGKFISITNGLTEGQDIAQNAQFLIDSESFVHVFSSPQ